MLEQRDLVSLAALQRRVVELERECERLRRVVGPQACLQPDCQHLRDAVADARPPDLQAGCNGVDAEPPGPLAIIVHSGGTIRFANAAAAQLFGVESTEALVGRKAATLLHEGETGGATSLQGFFHGDEEPSIATVRCDRCDGEAFEAEMVGIPVTYMGEPAVQVIVRRREAGGAAAAAPSEGKRLFELIANSVPAIISYIDSELRYRFVNLGHTEWLGLRRDQIIGRTVPEVLGGDTFKRVRPHVEQALAGHAQHFETVLPDGASGQRFVRVTYLPDIGFAGKTLGFIAFTQDISESDRSVAEIKAREEQFRQMAENIREVFWINTPEKNRTIYVSPAYEEIWGRSLQSLYETPMSFVEAIHPEDRQRASDAFWNESGRFDEEYRIIRPDGSIRWIRDRAYPVHDEHGNVYRIVGIAEDITEYKRTEEALRESEARLQAFFTPAPPSLAIWDENLRFVKINETMAKLNGLSIADHIGKTLEEVMPELAPTLEPIYRQVLETGEPDLNAEFSFSPPAQPEITRDWLVSRFPIPGPDGKAAGLGVIGTDITERKRAEEELRHSEEQFRQLAENIHEVFWLYDPRAVRTTYISPAFDEIWGISRERVKEDHHALIDAVHPDDRASVAAAYEDQTQGLVDIEYRIVRPDGSIRWVWDRGFPVRDDDGNVYRVAGIAEDISKHKQVQEAIRASEARLRSQFESFPVPTYSWRISGDDFILVDHNRAAMAFTQGKIASHIGQHASEFFAHNPEQIEMMRQALDKREPVTRETWYRMRTTGEEKYLVVTMIYVAPDTVLVHTEDISERRLAERALELTQFAVDRAGESIFLIARDGTIRFVNDTACRVLGCGKDELLGMQASAILGPTDAPEWNSIWDDLKKHGTLTRESVHQSRTRGDFPVEVVFNHVVFAGEEFICAFARDITLRNENEQRLRQAQKMEAIGQLTGGVAHEFNNLLAVVMGNLDFLCEEIAGKATAEKFVNRALAAAERGASLTQRLLSFSRQQPLQPRATDLNALVLEAHELLLPTLGETIKVRTDLADDLWPTLVDAAQLQTAVLTLVVNAQDAMPAGGVITIETRNVCVAGGHSAAQAGAVPGDYVLLEVRDRGTGMAPEVKERAFDPFFTTKEVGKGTGLGLSMVHGFVTQSGGHVEIESKLGSGTVLRIFMPRAENSVVETCAQGIVPCLRQGRGETILVVEDDSGVREYAVALLSDLGYRTLQARDGTAALRILGEKSEIDLLFTDVVLPRGLSGFELARRARGRHPGLKCLFASGYSETAIAHHGRPEDAGPLLRKPYRRPDLAARVAAALQA